jgi:hypothetical protein
MVRSFLFIIYLTCLWIYSKPAYCQKQVSQDRLLLKSTQNYWDNLDSVLYENFITATEEWHLEAKYQYRYDEMNRTVQYAAFMRDNEANCWVNLWKDDYTRDANGYMILSVFCTWDTTSGDWKFGDKRTYINDSKGRMLVYNYYYWDNGEWINAMKGEFTLNDDGNTTDDLFYSWDVTDSAWVNRYKDEFSYDAEGRVIESTGYSWLEAESQWNPETRYDYEWDENGNNNNYTGYDWNETVSEWLLDNKTDVTFDDGGKELQELYFVWNQSLEQWTNYSKVIYSYNDQDKRTGDLSYDWDPEKGEWIYNLRRTYYYHQVPTALPGPESLQNLIIYPNPAISFINTDLIPFPDKITVILYDSEGRKVIIQELLHPDPIYIGHLKSGIYFYKIIAGNEMRTGKLLITSE